MMKLIVAVLVCAGVTALAGDALAQGEGRVPRLSPRPAAANSTLVSNRARALGDKASASGVRYFAVTDHDLHDVTEVATRLSPSSVRAGDGTRQVEVLVDLRHPVTIRGARDTAAIGTVFVEAARIRGLDVHASIFTAGVTIAGPSASGGSR